MGANFDLSSQNVNENLLEQIQKKFQSLFQARNLSSR